MALFGSSASTDAGNDETQKVFIDDDEETLSLLLAGSRQEQMLSATMVESFVGRFRDDHFPENEENDTRYPGVWEDWTKRVNSMGFSVSYLKSNIDISTRALASDKMPAALQSEDGQLHLEATSSILSVSKSKALQLTLAAMRSVNDAVSIIDSLNESKNSTLQALLGTRAFLEKVIEYYYKQRLARTSLIAEFLRMEQECNEDGDNVNTTQVVALLDKLDQTWTERDKNRGLFRILLTVCCQPENNLSWTDFQPAKNLEGGRANNTLNVFVGDSPDRVTWNQFVRDAMNRKRWYLQRERVEALEAILVLLYNRIHQGARRSDLAMLFAAFDSRDFFKSNPHESFTMPPVDTEVSNRLPFLTGLVFIESMALWRIVDPPTRDNESSWIAVHPLFHGKSVSVIERELLALANIFDTSCSERGLGVLPESLAVLAFGLLLHAAGIDNTTNISWSVVSHKGMELAMRANNEFDTFSYFYRVMEKLVLPASIPKGMKSPFSRGQFLPYEPWAFEGYRLEARNHVFSELELTVPSLAYASIGRELLIATIHAFQSKLIPENHIPDRENITMLSSLVSVTFRNSPSLCGRFWADWEAYFHPKVSSPICSLLKAAHDLASVELRGGSSDEQSMLSVVPFLRIVASLIYNPDTAEFVLSSIIPEKLIRHTLSVLVSRSATMNESGIYVSCREQIIDSICTLARVGNSSSCRNYLRAAIKEKNSSGLRNLLHIVLSLPSDDSMSITKIFGLISELLTDAPLGWVHDAIKNFRRIQDSDRFWQSLFRRDNSSVLAVVTLINCFVSNMNKVIMGYSLTDEDIMEILTVIRLGVDSASNLLVASLSTTSFRLIGDRPLSYCSAAMILEFVANTMNCLKPIIEFHESKLVRGAALEIRDNIMNMLAARKGLGEAVFLYAVAPVSLNIANNLETVSRDSDVISLIMNETKNSESFQGQLNLTQPSMDLKLTPPLLSKVLSSTNLYEFDFEAIRSRGWLYDHDDAESCLRAAYNALCLLNCWGKCVDTKLKSIDSEKSFYEARLLSPCIYLGLSVTWPQEISNIRSTHDLPVFSFLVVYLSMARSEEIRIEPMLTLEVFELVCSCLTHEVMFMSGKGKGGISDDSVFHAVFNAGAFTESIRSCMSYALDIDLSENPSTVETLNAEIGLNCIRSVASFFDSNPSLAARKVSINDGFWTDLFSTSLKRTSSSLQAIKRENWKKNPQNLSLIYKLRFGCGCLHILLLIWKKSRSKLQSGSQADSHYLQAFVDNNLSFVSEIASLVFDNSDMLASPLDVNSSAVECKSIVFNIMAISLDFLSVEISTRFRSGLVSDLQVVRALESSLGQSISKVIDTVNHFTLVSSFQTFSSCYEKFSSVAGNLQRCPPLLDSVLNLFANERPIGGSDFDVGYNNRDISALVQLVYEVQPTVLSISDCITVVTSLRKSYSLFSSEIRCLVSWKSFTQLFHLLLQKMRDDECDSSLLVMPDAAFCLSMMDEILMSLSQNLEHFEKAKTNDCLGLLKAEALSVTKHSSGLLLTFGQVVANMTESQWVRSMDLVCKIGEIISKIDYIQPRIFFSTMKQIFALAIMLSRAKPEKLAIYDSTSTTAAFHLSLIFRSCTVIRALEKMKIQKDEYTSCFCTCVAFLTTAIESPKHGFNSSWENGVTKVCEVLQELGVIRCLVDQATAISCVHQDVHDSDYIHDNEKSLELNLNLPVFTTLDLFTRLAATGLNCTLLLLKNNEASRLLWMPRTRPRFHAQISGDPETKDVTNRISNVLKAKIKFIAACLRSLNQSNNNMRDVAMHFINVAIEFVQVHNESFQASLKSCCTSDGSKHKFLTLDSLNDAESVLSIIVELCSGNALEILQRDAPILVQGIRYQVLSLIASLGNFLGASAASRDLFRAADRMSSENIIGLDQGSFFASLGPDQHLLAGGLQNAKHEAIRYSHFVSKVSKRDFPAFALSEQAGGSSETKTMASLENACRVAVTQDFESTESQAAKCLFSALQVLWKTHPSANCFVSFSTEEAAHLDAMRLVKPGSVIGFRKTSKKTKFDSYGGIGTREDISFGRVICCDTIRRQWHVLVEGKEKESVLVQDIQLAGVEDMTKRTSVLAYYQAPDSSATIETVNITASIGHLILALRWCSQFYSEIQRNGSLSTELKSITIRLAELGSAVLGAELSIADEIRKQQNLRQSELRILMAKQLMDLFGDSSDFEGHELPDAIVVFQSGRLLKNLVSHSSWLSIRNQLKEYIEMAVTDLIRKTANHPTGGISRIPQ